MKKIRITCAACAVLAGVAAGAEFFVAPQGRDGAPGTREQPLARVEAARDAARAAGAGPHRIVLLPGDYYLTAPLDLDARDNGLTLEAEEAGRATVYGGRAVTGWRRDGERFWCADLPGVKAGGKIAFNLGVYRAEDRVWRSLEGALGENWRLDQAAELRLK